jgi:RNA polymerase sigma-70 factor (ECF subfamily)
MARALATLAPPEREAVVLFELEGFTLDEVATAQQSSIPAVKSRLVRARARLRRHYEREERVTGPAVQERRHEHG